jgi:L-alanine-DL-glutamate epimerase-like enolase superfamily enzyme
LIRIARVEMRRYRRRLHFANARATWSERSGLWLRLIDDRGTSGVGEAAPLPGYSSGDDIDRAQQCLHERLQGELSLPGNLESACQSLRVDSPSANFAIETALFDLQAKRQGLRLSELLAETAVTLVPATHLIDRERPLEDSRTATQAGFSTLKLKLGPENLLPAIEWARCASDLWPRINLRLDANGTLTADQSATLLAGLAGKKLEFLEEPGAGWDELRAAGLPLAADESLQDGTAPPEGIIRVLKPTALGGLLRCVELSRNADAVVSHTLEGPVGGATCAELALAIHSGRRAAGIETHAGLLAFPEVKVRQIDGANIRAIAAPGHGIGWEMLP